MGCAVSKQISSQKQLNSTQACRQYSPQSPKGAQNQSAKLTPGLAHASGGAPPSNSNSQHDRHTPQQEQQQQQQQQYSGRSHSERQNSHYGRAGKVGAPDAAQKAPLSSEECDLSSRFAENDGKQLPLEIELPRLVSLQEELPVCSMGSNLSFQNNAIHHSSQLHALASGIEPQKSEAGSILSVHFQTAAFIPCQRTNVFDSSGIRGLQLHGATSPSQGESTPNSASLHLHQHLHFTGHSQAHMAASLFKKADTVSLMDCQPAWQGPAHSDGVCSIFHFDSGDQQQQQQQVQPQSQQLIPSGNVGPKEDDPRHGTILPQIDQEMSENGGEGAMLDDFEIPVSEIAQENRASATVQLHTSNGVQDSIARVLSYPKRSFADSVHNMRLTASGDVLDRFENDFS